MDYLVDTNVILRVVQDKDAEQSPVGRAVDLLVALEHHLYVASQNLVEFWNVATRPTRKNGFGLTVAEALDNLRATEMLFELLPDHPDVYGEWRQLVVAKGVMGKQVHDARLVATMKVYGITHILTFNVDDFQRYASEGIVVVHPENVSS